MIGKANSKSSIVNSKASAIRYFTDLDTWKVSHAAVLAVYRITREFPKEEQFGLVAQLRRAVASITANIAEGWGRYHFADKIRFYYQARGSNAEVQNFLILSRDLGFCSEADFDKVMGRVMDSFRVINGLIRSVEKQKR